MARTCGRLAASAMAAASRRVACLERNGRTQPLLGFDGLIVPSARWDCRNVILFCDEVPPESCYQIKDHDMIDWRAWVASNKDALPA
jgi:hypothetical protein